MELADTMVDHFDVIEFLHRLVERSLELMDCAEVGLLLANAAGNLQVMASSSERSEALELLQSRNEQGPCFDCYRGSIPVFSEDLRADSKRWPTFAPAAVKSGINSVHAIPMRVHSRTIGALMLHLAATEVYYGLNTFDGLKWDSWPDSVKKQWDPAMNLGKAGRDTIKGSIDLLTVLRTLVDRAPGLKSRS